MEDFVITMLQTWKTPPAMSRAGLETNEPDLSCRPLSSRNQLAAPQWAGTASRGDGGREGEHDAKLEQQAWRVKASGLAQTFELGTPSPGYHLYYPGRRQATPASGGRCAALSRLERLDRARSRSIFLPERD
jgi:hypothetical protein